jgi:hypothetical protein
VINSLDISAKVNGGSRSLKRVVRRLAVMVKGKCERKYCSRPQHNYGLCRWHWALCVRNTVAIFDAIWPPSKPPNDPSSATAKGNQ